MKLTKFEQSGFVLELNDGFRLAFDIGSYTPLENLEGLKIDAMLVSHIHVDHFSVPHIKKISPKTLYLNEECIEILGEESLSSEIKKIKVGDEIIIGDIKVNFFDVDHGPNVSVRPKENLGFLIKADGQVIYFAGDMFYPSGINASILEVDYALLPVGTHYTFGPEEAFNFAKQFMKIGKIIPMHYEKTPETKTQFIELAKDLFNLD